MAIGDWLRKLCWIYLKYRLGLALSPRDVLCLQRLEFPGYDWYFNADTDVYTGIPRSRLAVMGEVCQVKYQYQRHCKACEPEHRIYAVEEKK